MTRRRILVGGVALFAAGCQQSLRTSHLPGMTWPHSGNAPPGDGSYVPDGGVGAAPGAGTPERPISRTAWTRAGQGANINPMGGVWRITVHHSGMRNPTTAVTLRDTAGVLESIRRSHRNHGWADIGYHFVIDRSGRVWEGRPLRYQGAHVRDHNEHNIGVMVLGNFDLQYPSDAQLTTLEQTVRHLRRAHRVSEGAIFTHQELNSTRCPGLNLQPRVEVMRASHRFA